MATLNEMFRKTTSTSEFDRMLRSIEPLNSYFGVNHFYLVRISKSGHCSTLGSHSELMAYLLDNVILFKSCPLIRQYNIFSGVTIPKLYVDSTYRKFIDVAWDTYQVNFTINMQREYEDGIVHYGFGVNHKHPLTEQRFFNELPLLNHFLDHFNNQNAKLIRMAYEYQVDMGALLGSKFFETPQNYPSNITKGDVLSQLGMKEMPHLTKRELEIVNYAVEGCTARYIANELHLSVRTVQNHLATIKDKLCCPTKQDLILQAKKFATNPLLRV